ncbi:type II toxin-antitoxin system death-on-curing family toxin [candidate division KSB1 bacterium]|nr:type II toxin-antitoxin system death-on-curing family toxin [candidate division KSB1 bacterium]
MGKTGQIVKYLSFQEIVERNRRIVLETGGFVEGAGKLSNPNSLEYLVNIVQEKINDKELYPSLVEKAAVYVFNIITRHIFIDGNKRTGMICAFWFLRLNGCIVSESISENEIVKIALDIANRTIDLPEIIIWLQERLE